MSEPMLVTEAVTNDRKRVVRLLVAAAVVVVLALVVPRFLFGGGDEADEFEFPASAPATPMSPDDLPDDDAVEVVRAFSTRNPFTPLVSAAPPAQDPTQGTAVPVAGPEAPVVVPQEPVIVVPDLGTGFPTTPPPTAPPTAPPATVPPPAPAPGESRFSLAEVFQDPAGQVLARVRINDVVHEVVVGHDFADHYRFVSADLASRCASFLFGDNRFELCEGEETRA